MALFVDLVALSNGLHGSVQMDSVALFLWIGWLRHHGILTKSNIIYFRRDMFYIHILLNKEFYLSTIRTLFLNTIDKQKKRRPLSLLYFSISFKMFSILFPCSRLVSCTKINSGILRILIFFAT